MKTARYFEDPSIADCCAIQFESLWNTIEDGVSDGVPFYVAREKVLAYSIPRISKLYGPIVAERVAKMIQWKGPHDVSKSAREAGMAGVRAIVDARWQARLEAEKARRGGRLLLIDRICIAIFGQPFTTF